MLDIFVKSEIDIISFYTFHIFLSKPRKTVVLTIKLGFKGTF